MGWFNDFTNKYPFSNFHELNLSWFLMEFIKLKEDVKNFYIDFGKSIVEEVNKWLDNHPEATTTVLDNSITSVKLKHDNIPFYNVTDYGILPNTGDVYESLYDFIAEYPYNTGGVVYFPKGVYTVSSTIFVPENTTFIGDGEETEIYFDETDTYFGTALGNAGSNVTIKNMKVSQLSKGVFQTGPQPGCIGFSNITKEQAVAGKYTRQIIRGEVKNLIAENIVFDGFYPIQTEPDHTSAIHNVIYRNLYGASGCMSAVSHSEIENLLIENVVCDLFRISVDEGGVFTNVKCDNITCQNFGIANPDSNSSITINNMTQTDKPRRNSNSGQYCGVVNGNVFFTNSVITAINPEIYGVGLFNGVASFDACVFNMYDRVTRREVSLSTNNYMIANSCTFNSQIHSTNDSLIGYGTNNTNNASNVNILLWGDIHRTYTNGIGIDLVTSSYPATMIVDGDNIKLIGYGLFSNDLTSIFTLGNRLVNLPWRNSIVNFSLWSSASRSSTTITTYGTVDNGVFKSSDTGISGSSAYDRYIIDTSIELTRTPTPTEIYEAFG